MRVTPDDAAYAGDLPDTIPAAVIAAHVADARRIVARSAPRPAGGERVAVWANRMANLAMAVAAAGMVATLGLLVVALPVLGVPLMAVATAVCTVAVIARIIRHRSG